MKSYEKTIRKFERSYETKASKTLKDLKNTFKDKKEVSELLKKGNRIIYETFTKNFSPINLTLTVVNPGEIDREFYLTKGHVHKKKAPEFYILLEGNGTVFLEKGRKTMEKNLKEGEIILIPEGYAHRLINKGRKKLKVLTIYHEDSMPNYDVKFKRRFFDK